MLLQLPNTTTVIQQQQQTAINNFLPFKSRQ